MENKSEKNKGLTLKTLTKSSAWDIQENDVFRLWEGSENDSDVRENIRHYQDILRSAFMIEEVKDDSKAMKAKYEKQGYKVGQVKLDANNLTEANLKQFTAAQGELTNAFSKLMLVAERYPELKASENFKSLQIQEEGTENRISEARRKYNEAVQSYNVKVRRMPNAIIAGLFGFDTMPKFEAAAGSEKAPDLDI